MEATEPCICAAAQSEGVSDEDFIRQYPTDQKPEIDVDIGKNSCNICN